MASSSSLRPRNDNSNIDIAEHDEECTAMASSSLPSRLTYTSFGFVTAEFYEAGLIHYLELYKAVLNGDWESALKLLTDDPQSLSAPIGTDDSPVLHIAVELGEASMGFVEKLVEFMPSDKLDLLDSDGATALFNAVRAGNIKSAQLLVNKKSDLPNICNYGKLVPLHSALRQAWIRTSAQTLMVGFHDVALYLVERYPHLATCHFNYAHYDDDADDSDEALTPLTVLAKRPWAFPSGSRFNLCQLIIYHC
ncbi:hypothetical protein CK203_037934 [Vitis vinifera]|uniref:Uncharacterized protein n=1 Tax=Vitis vinifera TaxID=29760 RepID=A0A438ICC0_VITVI|nr:hypothetical protein CK203_037934 [Vitis vinifera]